jgi:hypothetical protein
MKPRYLLLICGMFGMGMLACTNEVGTGSSDQTIGQKSSALVEQSANTTLATAATPFTNNAGPFSGTSSPSSKFGTNAPGPFAGADLPGSYSSPTGPGAFNTADQIGSANLSGLCAKSCSFVLSCFDIAISASECVSECEKSVDFSEISSNLKNPSCLPFVFSGIDCLFDNFSCTDGKPKLDVDNYLNACRAPLYAFAKCEYGTSLSEADFNKGLDVLVSSDKSNNTNTNTPQTGNGNGSTTTNGNTAPADTTTGTSAPPGG